MVRLTDFLQMVYIKYNFYLVESAKNQNNLDKAINNLIDVNKGKKINYFSYNLNDSPNGNGGVPGDNGENIEENLNNNQKGNENNQENNSSAIVVSEAEIEKHIQLIDILIELEIVKFILLTFLVC